MLIPMISFRDHVGIWSVPIAFRDVAEAVKLLPEALRTRNIGDVFTDAIIACEYNPETGEVFSVGENISNEFNFIGLVSDPEESEVINEESPVEESFSEEIP